MMYEVSTQIPRDCFPVGYDRSNLRNVSGPQDYWAVYLDVERGETVRCEDFAREAGLIK